MQHSVDREVSQQERKKTLTGNGLAPAILRKGRLIFIDEDLFLAWLMGGRETASDVAKNLNIIEHQE